MLEPRSRRFARIEGVTVHFISKRDLIQNKRQVGRLIDLADAEQLALLPDTSTPFDEKNED